MNKLLTDLAMQRQMFTQGAALALLLAAVAWPAWLARPAGAAFALGSGWLFYNLLRAARLYHHYMKQASIA
jgi:hypothetical protein